MSVAHVAAWTSWRLPGCGPRCTPRVHDPRAHYDAGRADGLAEAQHEHASAVVVATGPLEVLIGRAEARVDGAPVPLAPTEWRVLRALALGAGRLVALPELIGAAWEPGWFSTPTSAKHAARMSVHRLRKRLGPDAARLIVTRFDLGYLLEVPS